MYMYKWMYVFVCMKILYEGYNYFREWCGLKRAKKFSDLKELPLNVIKRFRLLYECVFVFTYTLSLKNSPVFTCNMLLGPLHNYRPSCLDKNKYCAVLVFLIKKLTKFYLFG